MGQTCSKARPLEGDGIHDAARTRFTIDLALFQEPEMVHAVVESGRAIGCAKPEVGSGLLAWQSIPATDKRPPDTAALHITRVGQNAVSLYVLHGECNEEEGGQLQQQVVGCSTAAWGESQAPTLVLSHETLERAPLYLVVVSSRNTPATLHVSYELVGAGDPPGGRLWRAAPRPGALCSSKQLALGAVLLAAIARSRLRRGVTTAAVAVWVASRVCTAGGMLWVCTPLVGYLRFELGVALLSASALLVAVLWRRVAAITTNTTSLALLLVVGAAVLLRMGLPHPRVRYNIRTLALYDAGMLRIKRAASNETITAVRSAFTPAECDEVVAGILAEHDAWTYARHATPLPYFSLGINSNHAGADERAPPWWSYEYGFARLVGNEGSRVLGLRGRAHREQARSVLRDAAWLKTPLRRALAARLQVGPRQVVFGGEGAIAHLEPPAAQIYLPSVAWAFLVNPHSDDEKFRSLLLSVGGTHCDEASRLAFLLPVATPPGAGLLHWNLRDHHGAASDTAVERVTVYERGALYSWPLTLQHALAAWPYREWDAAALRITLQTFGVRCGETWYFYH